MIDVPSAFAKDRRPHTARPSGVAGAERLFVVWIVLAAAFAYANALTGEFVYDDRFQILRHPTIQSLANIPRMFRESVWQFMSPESASAVGTYYRPLFNVALIVNFHLFRENVLGWHAVSLFLHLGVCFLVYRLARRWTSSIEIAGASALLFALHPVHTESVAWISGLPDVLAALLLLSSLLAYRRVTLLLSVVLAFLAMLVKEVAVVFPLLIACYVWIDSPRTEPFARKLVRALRRMAPFVAAAVIYLSIRYAVLGFVSRHDPNSAPIPSIQVLLTIPSVLLGYARMLFVPFPLAATYGKTYLESPADPRFWGALSVVLLLVVVGVRFARRSAAAARALALLVVFLLPVLNLKAFNFRESLLHDRYLYLPSVGFCVLIALALHRLAAHVSSRPKPLFWSVVLLLGIVLGGLTISQNRFWRTDFAMVDHALRVNPRSPFLHNYLGAWHFLRGDLGQAEVSYREALRYDPAYADAYSNLGDVHLQQGRLAEAERLYLRALAHGGRHAAIHFNLGVAYTGQGRWKEARKALLEAIELQPSLCRAHYNLGWISDTQGDLARAERAYQEALRCEPSYVEARINLGVLLTRWGRSSEAIRHLEEVRRAKPDHPTMLFALGDALARSSRFSEAIEVFERLAARAPRHPLVHTALGLCYERTGDRDRAKAEFGRAIEVAPSEPYTEIARGRLATLEK